jgi:aminoglycoside 3-N-acetyltransferase-4
MPSWTGDDEAPFDPATTPVAGDLGATADLFWRQSDVLRSDHLQAFAAVGPRAEAIVKTPLPLPPHVPDSPVGRVYDLDGQVLLLGVGHDVDTSLHLAELLAGVPYGIPRHCMVMQEGRRVRLDYVENDHCCERFALADDWLRARRLQSEGKVGHAMARLARARDIVDLAVDTLRRQPTIFLHTPEEGCADCDEARNGGSRATL